MKASVFWRVARTTGLVLALMLAGIVAYLCLWPIPAEPVSWQVLVPPGYVGAHAANTRLAGLNTITLGQEYGPEHLAVGPDGKLYAAMTSGSLVCMNPDGSDQQVFAIPAVVSWASPSMQAAT